jgi:putative sigma-54 modulation protein
MNIRIKATDIDLTPSLKTYAEEKLGALEKYVKKFEAESDVEMRLELARTTRHHHKGNVFKADANIILSGKMFRAEDTDSDIRVAIDHLRDKLKAEIEKYKEKSNPRETARKK